MKDSVVAELATKAQQGDSQAFEQLYTEFSPLIYSILLEITHDTYEAEDLTQDCFISAFRNIHTLKDPLKTKKWLTAIAANHGKDYLKKKKPALLGAEHEYIFDIQEEKNSSLLPDESAILDERSKEIREIVNSVSEDKRLCLVLFYQHEMSITGISEELGISESAVKSRLFRAREDIREEVEKRNKKGMPLFGVAPLPLILFALQKSSQAAATSFAGSAAQTAAFAEVTAAVSQTGIAAASTAATATTATSATASAASTTATATATGIGAKVAAMSVAQKVVAGVAAASIVTGSATVTTVVVKNKTQAETTTTTAYVEEVTTAPDYGFESETVFIPAVAETESLTSELSTNQNSTSSVKQSTTVALTKGTEKSTVANKTTTKSTTKSNITTQKQTTTKATTTKPQTTTTTKVTTTEEETTTAKVTTTKATTTKAVTTTKAETTTTTKATTTTTTESVSPATVTVTIWGEETSTTKTLYFEAGEKITAAEIENRLSSEYGIEAIADNINITAEAGGSYTATAYE